MRTLIPWRFKLIVKRFGETFDCKFGPVIKRTKRERDLAADGRDIDNRASAVCSHVRQHGLRDLHQADHVGVELTADALH